MAQPRRTQEDWHPADVMAALRKTKKKWSLRKLAMHYRYHETAVGRALRHPWPAVEAIIARELELHPMQIWPSRYEADGTPKRSTAHPLTQGNREYVSDLEPAHT